MSKQPDRKSEQGLQKINKWAFVFILVPQESLWRQKGLDLIMSFPFIFSSCFTKGGDLMNPNLPGEGDEPSKPKLYKAKAEHIFFLKRKVLTSTNLHMAYKERS